MLGYIKAAPDQMLVGEWRYYSSVYCGICRTIGLQHGQFERLAISFDVTFLATFLLAFSDQDVDTKPRHCLVHPLRKRPTAEAHPVLTYAADLTSFLAYQQSRDAHLDGEQGKSLLGRIIFGKSARQFHRTYPQLAERTKEGLDASWQLEQKLLEAYRRHPETQPETAQERAESVMVYSADLLAEVFREGVLLCSSEVFADERYRHILEVFARRLAEYVYLMDAFDDKLSDEAKGVFNPFAGLPSGEFLTLAETMIGERIKEIDYLGALFPYRRHAGIMENVLHVGLAQEFQRLQKKYKNAEDCDKLS